MTKGKTNAARFLDSLNIAYTLHPYQLDEHDLSATHIAELNHFDVDALFKTLVLRGDKSGALVVCLPGHLEVNLKALAAASGNKKVEVVPQKEVQGLTGYIRGSVSPLALKKTYPVYVDQRALEHPIIMVNAGQKGLLMKIAPADLVQAVDAQLISLAGDLSGLMREQ